MVNKFSISTSSWPLNHRNCW